MAKFGVLVLGYSRPELLRNVLESLRRQRAMEFTHVWLDGNGYRTELASNARCVEVVREYSPIELRAHAGHLGIEKMMLDALHVMSSAYDHIVILEDDCFPLHDAISRFQEALIDIAEDASVFSAYGHHFGVPGEQGDFPRFQGWGWGTTAAKLRNVLPEIRELFNMSEQRYLTHVASQMTPEIRARLDCTPPRNVTAVLDRFYSWDSCLAFVTARRGLSHRPTKTRIVINCGITPGHGHFVAEYEHLLRPPYNMISPADAWNFW